MASSQPRSSSGMSAYSPISTLERQYTNPGQRLHLFCRTNAACCLSGGVETLLKLQHSSSSSSNTTVVTSSTRSTASTATTTTDSDDPFSFLNNGDTLAPPQQLEKKKSVGGFLKSVAKKTSQNLERGMTNMAIRADQGRNPDVLCMGLYNTRGELVAMTEEQALATDDVQRLQGCWFAIPLVVPTPGQYTVELWIKSGAALLKSGKHYFLGSVMIDTSQQELPQQVMLPLQSSVVVDGQVHLNVKRDLKVPPPYSLGWSLTDPLSNSRLHNLPLDASYGYSCQKKWFVATERAVESTLVLPIASAVLQTMSQASQVSHQHALSVANQLHWYRHDSPLANGKAQVDITVGYLHVGPQSQNQQASLSLHWQRPDCIFQVELMPFTNVPLQTTHTTYTPTLSTKFCPPVITKDKVLSSLLAKTPNVDYMLGTVRLEVYVSASPSLSSSDHFAPCEIDTSSELWHATICLEPLLINSPSKECMQIPLTNSQNIQMGVAVLQLNVTCDTTNMYKSPQVSSAKGGLVSLVGLDTLLEDTGSLPVLDYASRETPPTTDPNLRRRQEQLKSMGPFISHAYLQQHVSSLRSVDCKSMAKKAQAYAAALTTSSTSSTETPDKDKTPKPFRPSSSRMENLLSGIPFNVHIHSLTVSGRENAVFTNVTCGAPADHARGFGNILSQSNGTIGANTSPVGSVSGGLRRLESKRAELAKAVQDAHSRLIHAVGQYMAQARQAGGGAVLYISGRQEEISQLRWKVFEATQALHHVTWTCAVRRAHVFSQALGIAISSFLSCMDKREAWPDLWVRHGYLVGYEGLLSAAGKELGMIEDASVGINMLRMVYVVLVSDDNAGSPERVVVPNSPSIKWVSLVPSSGVGSQTQFRLEIGVDCNFYENRVPAPLQNGAPVRLYPLLFEVGVDIRQWGSHQQRNARNQLTTSVEAPCDAQPAGGLLDDEDDDVGITDDDVLIALNYEALYKLNAYAHAISPVAATGGDLLDSVSSSTNQQQQVHPTLEALQLHVSQSHGKMNHAILDEAALVVQSMGGGGVVFCKSGKDRTAMHVTYKQAQFARRHLERKKESKADSKVIFKDATLMRIHGTRLPICEKNVGQALFAFNALQVKFMPEMLRPPPSTLAGFLKGGRVFSGGAIES